MDDPAGPGPHECTLRAAIEQANADPSTDTIVFNIPGAGPHTIQPLSGLPSITNPVVIDGYTQPGAAPNTSPSGSGLNTVLKIELDGSLAGDANGLTLYSGNSTIRGLAVNRFGWSGIVAYFDNNVIEGNFIGTNASGTAARANVHYGMQIIGAENRVGTDGDGVDDLGERNIISGNGGVGVHFWSTAADDNVVAGNFIGTDVTGTGALPNANLREGDGVRIYAGQQHNLIGTNGDGVSDEIERNILSGNGAAVLGTGGGGWGVGILGGEENVVAGNYIGLDVTGTKAVPNGQDGIRIIGSASGNLIGTDGDGVADEAERNVISGNPGGGVLIVESAHDNVVAGNYIGTDATGTVVIRNWDGVRLAGDAHHNRIGTDGDGIADSAERNVISGNLNGVRLWPGSTAHHNVIAGNYVGTDVSGTIALGGGDGIQIDAGGFNRIGTNGDGVADEAERNVISGNRRRGVYITGTSTHNVVAGNYIGTNVTGLVGLGNGEEGVAVEGGASSNIIGTDGDGIADTAERNLISGNAQSGVYIGGSAYNVVAGNYIGTDVTGRHAVANGGGVGIWAGGQYNTVGTNGDGVHDDAERNLISGNGGNGVYLEKSAHNVVAGNYIGTDITGTLDLGNHLDGVNIRKGSDNRIGTDGNSTGDEAERNLISGNDRRGVAIYSSASDNVLAGNYIGTDVTGAGALPNTYAGVVLYSRAVGNRIGTDGSDDDFNANEGNVISGNGSSGVVIVGGTTERNVVAGNHIGSDVTGQLGLGNGGDGVVVKRNSRSNIIGGGTPAQQNVIAFNGANGVTIGESAGDRCRGNQVQGNSIHSNALLGINLGNDGVTLNDTGDVDAGPNNLQNFPVISAVETGAVTQVVGTLQSAPGATYEIDFYASDSADSSGYGEGQRWLGSADVTTDGTGSVIFDVGLTAVTVSDNVITATTTDADGNTSEFSYAAAVPRVPIQIDVKPGSNKNPINLASKGVIPVAIFTTADFNAADVDVSTVIWAGAHVAQKNNGSFMSGLEDVDGDGDLDLVIHFRLEETTLLDVYEGLLRADLADGKIDSNHQAVDIALEGMTNDGTFFRGSDIADLFLTGKDLEEFLEDRIF